MDNARSAGSASRPAAARLAPFALAAATFRRQLEASETAFAQPTWIATRTQVLAQQAGGARIILLVGRSGSGKTRMLHDLAAALRAQGVATQLWRPGRADLDPTLRGVALLDDAEWLPPPMVRELRRADACSAILAGGIDLPERLGMAGVPVITLPPLDRGELRRSVKAAFRGVGLGREALPARVVACLHLWSAGSARQAIGLAAASLAAAAGVRADRLSVQLVDRAAVDLGLERRLPLSAGVPMPLRFAAATVALAGLAICAGVALAAYHHGSAIHQVAHSPKTTVVGGSDGNPLEMAALSAPPALQTRGESADGAPSPPVSNANTSTAQSRPRDADPHEWASGPAGSDLPPAVPPSGDTGRLAGPLPNPLSGALPDISASSHAQSRGDGNETGLDQSGLGQSGLGQPRLGQPGLGQPGLGQLDLATLPAMAGPELPARAATAPPATPEIEPSTQTAALSAQDFGKADPAQGQAANGGAVVVHPSLSDATTRIALIYAEPAAIKPARDLARALRQAGYQVADPVAAEGRTVVPGIHYYFAEDADAASRIARLVRAGSAQTGVQRASLPQSWPRPGTIEMVVPARAVTVRATN